MVSGERAQTAPPRSTRVIQLPTAADFLSTTGHLRAQQPVLTNVLATIAQGVVDGAEYARCWWWTVQVGDTVVGCAVRTAPWNLAVSEMPDHAATALGLALVDADPDLPGVNGAASVARTVLAAFAPARQTRTTMAENVLVLGDLVPPGDVPGQAQAATPADVEELVAWHEQFAAEAGLPGHHLRAGVERRLAQHGLWWWTDGGRRVSLAGHTAAVGVNGGAVGRIGPVFTPREFRRRGYAAALTAFVAHRLQRSCSTVMLYADAANPTSNALYERLGFHRVAEIVELGWQD